MPDYKGDITLSSSVRNLDESIAWFKDMLGFDVIFRVDEAGWAEISTPTGEVSIGLGVNEEPQGAGGTTPVFGVLDIAAARAELEGKGVRFDGETQEIPGMVKLATFFDPDGNAYMFAESQSDTQG
ncbi:MAG: VOC family protein [Pseudomonadales bacterium]|nr:VOC family protein [Pseudomonadales bacterium]